MMDEDTISSLTSIGNVVNGDADEKVLLRSDSHRLRHHRRQSRERTPTALISSAFEFLNENLHSTIEVFENKDLDLQEDNCNSKDLSDGHMLMGENCEIEVFMRNRSCDKLSCGEERNLTRECVSKDSGFASLERHLDTEIKSEIKSVLMSFVHDKGEVNKLRCETNSSMASTAAREDCKVFLSEPLNTEPKCAKCSEQRAEDLCHGGDNVDNDCSVCLRSEDNLSIETCGAALSESRRDDDSTHLPLQIVNHDKDDSLKSCPCQVYRQGNVSDENTQTQKSELLPCDSTVKENGNDGNTAVDENAFIFNGNESDSHAEGVSSTKTTVPVVYLETREEQEDDITTLTQMFSSHTHNNGEGRDPAAENSIDVQHTLETNCEVENQYKSNTDASVLSLVHKNGIEYNKDKKHSATLSEDGAISKERTLSSSTGDADDEVEGRATGTTTDGLSVKIIVEDSAVTTRNEEEEEEQKGEGAKQKAGGGGTPIRIERNNMSSATISDNDSSDEDTGIYAESFRRSNWVRVSKEGKLPLRIPTPPTTHSSTSSPSSFLSSADVEDKTTGEESSLETNLPTGQYLDDVFTEPPDVSMMRHFHNRSGSVDTTASENEFKRSYISRRKCLIQRANSQQEYHRLSARIYEQDKQVLVERTADCQDLGLHLLDSHPAFITSVDPDSLADKAGIVEGQILVSVNNVSVLITDHADIVKLIQDSQGSINLGVANSDFQPVRDLQAPVMVGYMYKLGHSALVRMWKKRYFILRQDNCLYYYKADQENDPLGALPLCGYTVSRHTDTNKDFCFKAEKYGARPYFFMTDNRDQMTEWVGALSEAAARSKKRKESFLSVSSHNVGLPALDIRRPECSGYLGKLGPRTRSWQRRYCVLKDACIYYYKDVNSLSALGVAHLHGYTVDVAGHPKKKISFSLHPPDDKMRTFCFTVDNETDKKRWVESLIYSIQRWVKVDNRNVE